MDCVLGKAVFQEALNRNKRLKECEHMFYTEIQLYKKLIWRGVNLDIDDKKLSLKALQNTCPIQTCNRGL